MNRFTVSALVLSAAWVAIYPTVAAEAREVILGANGLRQWGSGPVFAPDVRGLPADPSLAVIDPAEQDEAAVLLRKLVLRGVSQGFGGLLYENRDWEHSTLSETLFPNLTFLKYDEKLRKDRLDYGLADDILIPALVFGNSSTAHTSGSEARSLARAAMTRLGGAARVYRNYVSNSLYIYPEHRDHDATDLYPANWPYQIISQGSSSSDQPFMKAIAMTLAAFAPDTRAALEREGLVAPTLQMILRRNLTLVRGREDYLSGAAHPTVFSSQWLRPERMVAQAAALRPDEIPPMVKLRIVEDDFLREAGLAGLDEHLFTTPSAIARVWRDTAWERHVTLSAAPTEDPNGRDLSFEWVILRGDPARIRIEPKGSAGQSAKITLNWHDAFAIPPRGASGDAPRLSSRVDVAVFASNGRMDSAPAILSVSFPTHELRRYEPRPDGSRRILSIDYNALERYAAYDPLLHWTAAWTDTYSYAPDGEQSGWTRSQGAGLTRFSREGETSVGDGITYSLIRREDGWTVLDATRNGEDK